MGPILYRIQERLIICSVNGDWKLGITIFKDKFPYHCGLQWSPLNILQVLCVSGLASGNA